MAPKQSKPIGYAADPFVGVNLSDLNEVCRIFEKAKFPKEAWQRATGGRTADSIAFLLPRHVKSRLGDKAKLLKLWSDLVRIAQPIQQEQQQRRAASLEEARRKKAHLQQVAKWQKDMWAALCKIPVGTKIVLNVRTQLGATGRDGGEGPMTGADVHYSAPYTAEATVRNRYTLDQHKDRGSRVAVRFTKKVSCTFPEAWPPAGSRWIPTPENDIPLLFFGDKVHWDVAPLDHESRAVLTPMGSCVYEGDVVKSFTCRGFCGVHELTWDVDMPALLGAPAAAPVPVPAPAPAPAAAAAAAAVPAAKADKEEKEEKEKEDEDENKCEHCGGDQRMCSCCCSRCDQPFYDGCGGCESESGSGSESGSESESEAPASSSSTAAKEEKKQAVDVAGEDFDEDLPVAAYAKPVAAVAAAAAAPAAPAPAAVMAVDAERKSSVLGKHKAELDDQPAPKRQKAEPEPEPVAAVAKEEKRLALFKDVDFSAADADAEVSLILLSQRFTFATWYKVAADRHYVFYDGIRYNPPTITALLKWSSDNMLCSSDRRAYIEQLYFALKAEQDKEDARFASKAQKEKQGV